MPTPETELAPSDVVEDTAGEAPQIRAPHPDVLAGVSERERRNIADLAEAAASGPLYAAEDEHPKVSFPGREADWVALRRADAFQSRKWRNMSGKVTATFRTDQSDDDGKAEGRIDSDAAECFMYLCQVCVEEFQITDAEGQVQKGGYSRRVDGASERGEVIKETRRVFGGLSGPVSDWLERVLMAYSGLTPEARGKRTASSD